MGRLIQLTMEQDKMIIKRAKVGSFHFSSNEFLPQHVVTHLYPS